MMDQDEITRRNEAIAKYMDSECEDQDTPVYFWFDDHYDAHELCFNENFEWLMPVVEKVIKERMLAIHIFPPMGHDTFVCRFGIGKNHEGSTMIEAVWVAVSEYILEKK